jgi:CRP-like cAMP-binding protein
MSAPLYELAAAALIGLGTTSSSIFDAALGLYVSFSRRVLACILAFAAGALISALAIELGYEGAQVLHHSGLTPLAAWAFISAGFAAGAIIYYVVSLFLEGKGAAVRYATQFREYALMRKRRSAQERIQLLAKSDLLRHLPPEAIEDLLPCIQTLNKRAGDVVFRAGEAGDALYIVASGTVEVIAGAEGDDIAARRIAQLTEGETFGEMALLAGGVRTATVRAVENIQLLKISKLDFQRLIASDYYLAQVIERISHARAISNLTTSNVSPEIWAKVANQSLDRVSRHEANRLLAETGKGAGIAIALGNVLDTIPGCLVIGAKFTGFDTLSLSLMVGMFLGGVPEAAASAAMLSKAGYRPKTIFSLWLLVILLGRWPLLLEKLSSAQATPSSQFFLKRWQAARSSPSLRMR